MKELQFPAENDMRKITRSPDRMLSVVRFVHWSRRSTWLVFGEARLRHNEKQNTWQLAAHLADSACDFEHDTAYAFQLPLIGLSFQGTDWHTSSFIAWIDPDDQDGFRVPKPGYNPMKHPKAEKCSGVYDEKKGLYCKWNEGKPHIIVPFFLPPHEPELWREVRGKKVEIEIGVPEPAEKKKK